MVRFETAQALFETFPQARTLISVEPTEDHSLDFLRSLAANGKLEDAVAFCCKSLTGSAYAKGGPPWSQPRLHNCNDGWRHLFGAPRIRD
jgi:hypothetical protein